MSRTVILFLVVIFIEFGSILEYLRRRNSPEPNDQIAAKLFLIPSILGFLFLIYFILFFLGVVDG